MSNHSLRAPQRESSQTLSGGGATIGTAEGYESKHGLLFSVVACGWQAMKLQRCKRAHPVPMSMSIMRRALRLQI